ncbi:MAG: metallophosphatase family protein [Anaerolineales bacterium]|nr:metallophosphatase family protein [Anaerolineales bacterium]
MSTILVISDIHANLIALEAVLADAGEVSEVWCLGDIVGYGPWPNECIERIANLPNLTAMMGNHDYALLDGIALHAFNPEARTALLWQKEQLSLASWEFLKSQSIQPVVRQGMTLVHGSPRDPIWEYVMNTMIARLNLEFFGTPWCVVGHSHFQAIFQYHTEEDSFSIEIPPLDAPYLLQDRAILNPGSVGQPRDRDPRAAYALYHPQQKTWEARRVAYDIARVQAQIRAVGLPERHAARLSAGW